MDQKKLLLMAGLLVSAGVMAFAAKSMISGAAAPVVQAVVAAPKGPRVLVAQHALPVGTIITADSVGFQEWPKNMVQDAYFIDGKASFDMSKLIGTVVRYPISAGQPLTQGSLVAPGDRGFLAAALSPGMRAITIPVSDKSSVAGFVFPGDHVDLMLTQKVMGAWQESSTPFNVTETILRNIRVLATDQSPTSESTPDGKTVVHRFATVTLEVTPRIAEKIEVAQNVGTLDMTLRAIADTQADYDRALASGTTQMTKPGRADVAHDQIEGATSFSTGGDVSRFQSRKLTTKHVAPLVAANPLGHAGHSIGVSVVRGNTVTAPTEGGDGMIGATTNLMNNLGSGSRRAGSTLGAAAPAAAGAM